MPVPLSESPMETPRTVLRPPSVQDAAEIFCSYSQDPKVSKYLTWSPHSDVRQTERFLHSCISDAISGKNISWVITHRTNLELMGMFTVRLHLWKAEIGYVIAQRYWSQGYMTEICRTVTNYLFRDQVNLARVWAVCDIDNIASHRVLEKVGMSQEGVLQRWAVHPALGRAPRDCTCYSLVR